MKRTINSIRHGRTALLQDQTSRQTTQPITKPASVSSSPDRPTAGNAAASSTSPGQQQIPKLGDDPYYDEDMRALRIAFGVIVGVVTWVALAYCWPHFGLMLGWLPASPLGFTCYIAPELGVEIIGEILQALLSALF